MTPDSLPIDRRFPGVGRIHRASGTLNPAVRRKINRALDRLYDNGRLDVLRAVRDGHVTPMQAYDAVRLESVHALPVGETMPLLDTAMAQWIDRAAAEYSDKHVNNLHTARRYFAKHDATAQVADLARVLEELRTSALGTKHPRSFNLARAAALAFVRATLKKSHPLWIAVSAVEPRKVPKRALGRALEPNDMRTYFPHPETDPLDAVAWSLATTGMGSKEYWGRWQTMRDRLHIKGTKRSGRERDVPLVRVPTVPPISRDWFEKSFRVRFNDITPYDMRRTFARWMELAGIPRTRRKLYLGHGARDVTDLYERAEMTAYLVDDGRKLRAFAGLPDPAPLTLVEDGHAAG